MSYESPAADTAQKPIYFGGGLGYDEQRNRGVLQYIETLGYETVTPLPDQELATQDPRFTITVGGLEEVISRKRAMRLAGDPRAEGLLSHYQQTRADNLAKMLEERGEYGGVHAIFQSADALNGLKVMHDRPDLIDSAIFAYPAGIIAQPRFVKAARGVFKSGLVSRTVRNRTAAENFEIEQHGKKPKTGRAANNLTIAASVALCDQSAMLHDAKSREDAPAVALVLGARDWMIRPERVISSLQSPNDVDHILVTDSPHGVNGRKRELQEWLQLFPVIQNIRIARRAGNLAVRPLAERITFFGDVPEDYQRQLVTLAEQVQ